MALHAACKLLVLLTLLCGVHSASHGPARSVQAIFTPNSVVWGAQRLPIKRLVLNSQPATCGTSLAGAQAQTWLLGTGTDVWCMCNYPCAPVGLSDALQCCLKISDHRSQPTCSFYGTARRARCNNCCMGTQPLRRHTARTAPSCAGPTFTASELRHSCHSAAARRTTSPGPLPPALLPGTSARHAVHRQRGGGARAAGAAGRPAASPCSSSSPLQPGARQGTACSHTASHQRRKPCAISPLQCALQGDWIK